MSDTIDNLPLRVSIEYAIMELRNREVQETWHIGEAGTIPPQIRVVDSFPKMSELDLLMGILPRQTSLIGYILPPPDFHRQRRSPFGFRYAATSFGKRPKHKETIAMLLSLTDLSADEAEERNQLVGCLSYLEKINTMKGTIVGNLGSVLQG